MVSLTEIYDGAWLFFQVSGNQSTSRHIYLWQTGCDGNKGGAPWGFKPASDKEEGRGLKEGILLKC